MMPRRSLDNNSSIDHQQQQQQLHHHEGNVAYHQQQQYSRSRTSLPNSTMVAATAGYSNAGGGGGFPAGAPDNSELRRYSISVAPGSTGGGLSEQQQQHMVSQQGQQPSMMNPNHPHATMTYLQQAPQEFIGEMSPALAQRMQINNMYLSQNSAPQNYPATAAEMTPEAQLEMRQQIAAQGGPMSQAEREEELLLNLLIARRQRGSAGDSANSQALADELMRLRQSRGAGTAGLPIFQGGAEQQQHPHSAYHQQQPMPGGGQMYLDYRNKPLGEPGQSNTNAPGMAQGDMTGRIDRAPTRLVDARSQEMLDLSGRGGGSKRGYSDFLKYGGGHPMDQHQQQMYGGHNPGMHMMQQPQTMMQPQPPPVKKRRIHKKKPADMPRRPLSAYNLFFSEERERILKEIEEKEGGGDKPKEEGDSAKEDENKDQEDKDDGEEKPKALLRPLIPAQKKRRPHRKTHGKISFQQLARMVGERWKSLPDDRRKYYQDLAKEDMARQKIAMEEYYAKQNAAKLKTEGTEKGEEPKTEGGGDNKEQEEKAKEETSEQKGAPEESGSMKGEEKPTKEVAAA